MNAAVQSLISYGSLEEAYPEVDPEFDPFGNQILFQLRTPKNMTRGGIALPDSARIEEVAQWNTQIAKVIALGPVCFKDRDTLAPWPEGPWCKVGEFVRIPMYGADRWWIPVPGRTDHRALFVVHKDLEVKGRYRGDPLLVDAFL